MIAKLIRILGLGIAFVLLSVALQWLVPPSLALVLSASVVFVWLERRLLLGRSVPPRRAGNEEALLEKLGIAAPSSECDRARVWGEVVRKFDPSFSPRGHSLEYVRGRFDSIVAAQSPLPGAGNRPDDMPSTLWQEIRSIFERSESLKLVFSAAFPAACAIGAMVSIFLFTTELGNAGLKRAIEIAVPMFTGHRVRIERLLVAPKFYLYAFEHRRVFTRPDFKSLLAFLEKQPRSAGGEGPYLVIEGARLQINDRTIDIELLRMQHPNDLRLSIRAAEPGRWSARAALTLIDLSLHGTYATETWLLPASAGRPAALPVSGFGRMTGAAGNYYFVGQVAHRSSIIDYRIDAEINASALQLQAHGDPIEITPDAAEALSKGSVIEIPPGVIGADLDASVRARAIRYSYRFHSAQQPLHVRADFSGEIAAQRPNLFEHGFRWRNIVPRSGKISLKGENIRFSRAGREKLRRAGWQLSGDTVLGGEARLEMIPESGTRER